MKSATIRKFFKDLSHNEIAMYLLLGIALINLLTYLQYNYFGGIIIFLFVGLLATHYTKNMVIVLAISILVTNLLISLGFLSNLGYKEGLDNKDGKDPKNPKNPKPKDPKDDDEHDDHDDHDDDDNKSNNLDKDEDYDDECEKDEDCDNGKCDMRSKKCIKGKLPNVKQAVDEVKLSMLNLDDPAVKNDTKIKNKPKSGFKNLDEEQEDSINLSNINSSQEQLMKEVQGQMTKLLGKNGIQNLDTNALLKQQKELMEAMKGMEPLIGGANKMIEGLSKSPIGGLLGLKGLNLR